MRRGCTRWLAAGLLSLGLGCDNNPPGDESGDGEGDGVWLEFGQGEEYVEDFRMLEDGDELEMVLGGQGLLMFPIPVRGGGFRVADPPEDWMHPHAPKMFIRLMVDDYPLYPGAAEFCEDSFYCVNNYPMGFDPMGDDTYLSSFYLTLFVPDELNDPCIVDGLPATLEARMEPFDSEPTDLVSLDVVLSVDETDLCP